MRRKSVLLALTALLWSHWASAQQPTTSNVLDWKAATTLNSYLMQKLHQHYAARPGDLARAAQTSTDAAAYRDNVRARFKHLLGPLPARTPLRAQVTGTLARKGFRIEKIIYESTPHHRVTANLYLPAGPGKWPAVLLPCGHEAEAKATVSYQKTALLFVTHGFAVLVPDPVSQGERMQLTDAGGKPLARGGTTEHTLLNAQAALVGHSLPAAELWDNVRGLDYLASRPEVDTARFGCVGNSGGATQAAYLIAFDKRLKVAALCSYVAAGERNLELTGPADGCVMLPGNSNTHLDIADWPIAFAPKPLLILAGRYDFVDYTSLETAQAEIAGIYNVLGQPQQQALFGYEDGHGISQPKREAAVGWFLSWARGDGKPVAVAEGALPVATAQELQCTPTGQVNTSFPDEINLWAFYQAEARRLAAVRPVASPEKLSMLVEQQLGRSTAYEFRPSGHEVVHRDVKAEDRDTVRRGSLTFRRLILRGGVRPPLPVLQLDAPTGHKATNRVIVCFSDRGKAALADSTAWLRALLQAYDAVLLVDLRGQGETADPTAALDPKYYNREYRPALISLHIGQPLLSQRVADVAAILRFSADIRPDDLVDLYADGRTSSLVAMQAAMLTSRIRQVQLRALPLSYQAQLAQRTAKNGYSDLLPGVLQHYDVPDLQRALGSRLVGAGTTTSR